MTRDQTIRVVIVEDDPSTREGLRILIGGTSGFDCVAAYSSVEEAVGAVGRVDPDVLLLDIHLPGMSGSAGVRQIRDVSPRTQVLMLTVYAEDDKIFESICNGASGYLLKKSPPARLLDAIREVHAGGAPMAPDVARKVIGLLRRSAPVTEQGADLTPNEVRLLGFLSEGHSYQSVAERLHISVNTVRNYIRSIYDKLHVHSKAEAVSKALKSGIIS